VDSFLEEAGKISKESYEKGGHILGYGEYLKQVAENPKTHLRDAAAFVKDMFDYYGTREVSYPWGKIKRFVLFDQPFATKADALMGQEETQQTFYSLLSSFVRAGKPHRLILLHGSNGSSKSTFVGCIGRGLENYSTTDEGAIYRFNWVFPSEKTYSSKLGFLMDDGGKGKNHGTFAHLDETEIEAKLLCELRDHPLLVLPVEERRKLMDRIMGESGADIAVPDLLLRGGMCPKCRLIFDALMVSYRGDLGKVLNHVQVERYYISRRYSRGFASVGPQMSVDGGERQVTLDRTLSALPKVLQNISFFEPFGELVDGSGGLIEFSDLLKRPVEAFKYLLETIETGDVQLGQSMHRINAVLVATSNEIHLNNFKQHPDSLSFLGRFSTIKMPYILSESVERQIYETQIVPGLGKHVTPHAVELAASWAVLTRLFKPNPEHFADRIKGLVKELMCTEKFEIYSEGRIPARFSSEETKLLSNCIDKLFHETDNMPVYEGITGASPREVKSIIYLASQNPSYECLTPMAVLEELEAFVKRTKDYSFLNMEKKEGHYHDFKHFIDILKIRLLQKLLSEVVESSDIFAERQFEDLWDRYVIHASTWVKGEKIFNPVTKKHEDPDEGLMDKVESLLEVKNKKEFREENLSRIAAAAIEKRHSTGHYAEIFVRNVDTLRSRLIRESLPRLTDLVERTLAALSRADGIGEGGEGVGESMPDDVRKFIDDFQRRHGYCPHCSRAVLGFLMREKLVVQD
jgi:predicted Ser/Thr protein kinase